MRKITHVIIGLFMIISFATIASAETQTRLAGKAITFAASTATCPGPALTFTPSPRTILSGTTNATVNFSITSGSTKTGANGLEYGILNTDTGIYQRAIVATTFIPAATDSATALPGDGWADKAGNNPATAVE